MPDEPRLFDYLTVTEHLQFTARLYGVADAETRAPELLNELELIDKRDALPGELSRAEMNGSLQIACGLLHRPSALVFDEPLTGLDPLGIRRMKKTILRRAPGRRLGRRQLAPFCTWSRSCAIASSSSRKDARICIHGSLEEISRSLPELQEDATLEEIFLRMTGHGDER